MKHIIFRTLSSFLVVAGCYATEVVNQPPAAALAPDEPKDCVVLPNCANAVRFRLYTNAAPNAPRLFNTFEIEAFGERLLSSPEAGSLRQSLVVAPTNDSPHNVLVNGVGPELGCTDSMKMIEQVSGPDWCYIALDVTPAYRGRLKQYQRGVLFVEPDLFILHDHLEAREPMSFQMLLHPPAATRVDPDWHDLRWETSKVNLWINSPSRRELRSWERVGSSSDAVLADTVTMKLGPTNKVNQIDLLTVFAVRPGSLKMDYAFKLVESNTAVGARIQRDGLPTLVAFRVDPANSNSSLDSFKFSGPVGVGVFRPGQRSR
jgi:hypothetical protein